MSNTLFGCEKFPQGRVKGAPANVNLGPHHISEIIRAGKLKFYTRLGTVKYSFRGVKIFRKGRPRGAAPHSVNSGPLISRKLLELEIWDFTHIYTGSSRRRARDAAPLLYSDFEYIRHKTFSTVVLFFHLYVDCIFDLASLNYMTD